MPLEKSWQGGRKLARISLSLLRHRRIIKTKMRHASTTAEPALHWFAAKLKLRGILAIARHEGGGLHPRAAILTLVAVVYTDMATCCQRLQLRHLPQEAGARILHDPRNAKLVANINDQAAATKNRVASLSNINIGLPQTWQAVRVLIATQPPRHRRVQRCTTRCRKRVARACQHNALKASGFGKLNNVPPHPASKYHTRAKSPTL